MKLKINLLEWDDIKNRLENGETVNSIIDEYPHVSKAAIYNRNSRSWNINLRKQKHDKRNHKKRRFTDEEELEIVRQYKDAGFSSTAIAKNFKCHYMTVLRILKIHKTAIRPNNSYEKLSGNKHPGWRGGRAVFTKEGYKFSKEYSEWRDAVFKRDSYKCVKCNSKNNIEADHIKPKSVYPEYIYDVSNGRTLCRACHEKTDTYGLKAVKFNRTLNESEDDSTFRIKRLNWKLGTEPFSTCASTYFGSIIVKNITQNTYAVYLYFSEFFQNKIIEAVSIEAAQLYAEKVWQGILLTHLERC